MRKNILIDPNTYALLAEHARDTGRSIKFCTTQAVRQWLVTEGVLTEAAKKPKAKTGAGGEQPAAKELPLSA